MTVSVPLLHAIAISTVLLLMLVLLIGFVLILNGSGSFIKMLAGVVLFAIGFFGVTACYTSLKYYEYPEAKYEIAQAVEDKQLEPKQSKKDYSYILKTKFLFLESWEYREASVDDDSMAQYRKAETVS